MAAALETFGALLAASTVLAAAPVASAQAAPRVADYTLTATLDPVAHVVDAEGTVRWTNPSAVPVRELWLHTYLNAFASEQTYFMRSRNGDAWPAHPPHWGRLELRALRTDDGADLLPAVATDPAVPDDATQLRVPLPREVAPGASVTLRMSFRAVLPEAVARTGWTGSFHMVGQWFPKVAVLERDGTWARFPFHANSEFYADYGRYDVRLRYPSTYSVGATGAVVEGPARVGAMTEERRVAEGVHDFAFVAWDRFRHADRRIGAVDVRVLHGAGDEREAARTLDVLGAAMPAFARRFGPYPYPVLTVVLPPPGAEAAGGMEYPTLITTGGAWWTPRRARFVEYVTLHEYGHQYFYGLLGSDEHGHPFLDEGFCEYATARVMEDVYGPGAPLVDLPLLGPRFDVWAWEALASGAIAHAQPVDTPAPGFPTWERYGAHVYARTAVVLRTLERRVGAGAFAATMRAYADAGRFGHPTPDTFYAAVRATLGERWEAFARTALATPWTYNLAVTGASSARGADGRWRGRAVIDREGPFALPVDVVFTDVRGGRVMVRIPNDRPTTVVPYEGGAELASVVVDPDDTLPLEVRRADNARVVVRRPGEVPPALPLVMRLAYWAALALTELGP